MSPKRRTDFDISGSYQAGFQKLGRSFDAAANPYQYFVRFRNFAFAVRACIAPCLTPSRLATTLQPGNPNVVTTFL
jgi:hypothetical protein